MTIPAMLQPQLARYLVAGALNTLLGYALFAVSIYLGAHHALALLIGGGVPVLTGYQAQRRYVFKCPHPNRLARFVAVFGVAYGANLSMLEGLLASGLAPDAYVGGLMALPPTVLLNFLMNRYLVFR